MIDYTFRYDPSLTEAEARPASAVAARQALVQGNRTFSEWMARCRTEWNAQNDFQYVIPCGNLNSVPQKVTDIPLQKPFAVVLGCSDARVPTEMIFGQGFNDLFVVRVAGHVLGDAAMGSMDFALRALSESVRVLVVLGHTNCGAVKGAVQAYLEPDKLWSKTNTPFLRQIFYRIFVAVRESDNALHAVWGPDAPKQPGYHEALLNMAVCLHSAHAAFILRQQVELVGAEGVDVLFGVYDVRTHQVCMPVEPLPSLSPEQVNLAHAPGGPAEMAELATQLAHAFPRTG